MYEIRLTEQGATPKMAARELNNINRDAAQEMGHHWHREFRPKHFTHAGATEYGYTPRAGERGSSSKVKFARSYTGRKLKKFGHTNPLVYSGLSRDLTRIPNIRSTATRGNATCRVRMNAPRLNMRNPTTKINLREELSRISSGESKQLADVARRTIQDRFAAIRSRSQKKLA